MANYKDNDPKGWCGDPKRGAALGRVTLKGELGEDKVLSITYKPWVDGDYDENGTYFGGGNDDKLYWVSSEDGAIDYMVRANNLYAARCQVLRDYPDAKISGDKYSVSLDNKTLQLFLDSECENCEVEETELNDEVLKAAKIYEDKILSVLDLWVNQNKHLIDIEENDFEPDGSDVVLYMSGFSDGAAYLYFMEHEGSGIGTWDGRWDNLFKNFKSTIRNLSKFVKDNTRKEYQALKDALENCALEGKDENSSE